MNPKEQDFCHDWHLNDSYFNASEIRSQSDPYIVQSLKKLNSFQSSESRTSPPSPVILHSSKSTFKYNVIDKFTYQCILRKIIPLKIHICMKYLHRN